MAQDENSPDPTRAAREARLAQALRANLRRRKTADRPPQPDRDLNTRD